MLRVLALAQDKNVPAVRNNSVSVELDSVVLSRDVVLDRISGTGYREYAVALVSTIKNDRRGFANAR